MIERTDTRREFKLTPEGTYTFTVKDVPVKKMTPNGKPYYIFNLDFIGADKTIQTHREFVMCWLAGPLLRALGCKEVEPDLFEWDKEEVVGRPFKAKIVHEPDRKEPTRMRARLADFESDSLPF